MVQGQSGFGVGLGPQVGLGSCGCGSVSKAHIRKVRSPRGMVVQRRVRKAVAGRALVWGSTRARRFWGVLRTRFAATARQRTYMTWLGKQGLNGGRFLSVYELCQQLPDSCDKNRGRGRQLQQGQGQGNRNRHAQGQGQVAVQMIASSPSCCCPCCAAFPPHLLMPHLSNTLVTQVPHGLHEVRQLPPGDER